jgi:hypothetical protein
MSENQQQNPETGEWEEAEPIPFYRYVGPIRWYHVVLGVVVLVWLGFCMGVGQGLGADLYWWIFG